MLILPDYKAFIFDMDGVLIDSEMIYTEMERRNFNDLGLNISQEEHRSYQGTATDEMWAKLRDKYEIHKSVEELVAMTNDLTIPVFQQLEKMPLMPKVEQLIKILYDKNVPMALASSSFPDVIDLVVEKSGMRRYFREVVNSRMAGKSKPAPDIFLLTAKKLNVRPEQCIVVEDSTNGIRAAKSAGMYCIAFNGPGAEFQDQSEADRIITGYDEIISLL